MISILFSLIILVVSSSDVFGQLSNRNIPLSDFTLDAVTPQLIYDPQNDLIRISCTNHDGSIALRWGDSTVTTTQGQRIPALAPFEIFTRTKVYVIAESGTPTMSCTVELR